jgi:hypothetical protein
MYPIQDLFLESFSYVLQFDMHFICTPMWTKFYSCKKWVLQFGDTHVYDVNFLKRVRMDEELPLILQTIGWGSDDSSNGWMALQPSK